MEQLLRTKSNKIRANQWTFEVLLPNEIEFSSCKISPTLTALFPIVNIFVNTL
jgi:hypothetical protein